MALKRNAIFTSIIQFSKNVKEWVQISTKDIVIKQQMNRENFHFISTLTSFSGL